MTKLEILMGVIHCLNLHIREEGGVGWDMNGVGMWQI